MRDLIWQKYEHSSSAVMLGHSQWTSQMVEIQFGSHKPWSVVTSSFAILKVIVGRLLEACGSAADAVNRNSFMRVRKRRLIMGLFDEKMQTKNSRLPLFVVKLVRFIHATTFGLTSHLSLLIDTYLTRDTTTSQTKVRFHVVVLGHAKMPKLVWRQSDLGLLLLPLFELLQWRNSSLSTSARMLLIMGS